MGGLWASGLCANDCSADEIIPYRKFLGNSDILGTCPLLYYINTTNQCAAWSTDRIGKKRWVNLNKI